MKKKIYGSFCILTIAILIAFNIRLATKGNISGVLLDSLNLCAQAHAESSSDSCPGTIWCDDWNGLHMNSSFKEDGTECCCAIASVTRGKKAS